MQLVWWTLYSCRCKLLDLRFYFNLFRRLMLFSLNMLLSIAICRTIWCKFAIFRGFLFWTHNLLNSFMIRFFWWKNKFILEKFLIRLFLVTILHQSIEFLSHCFMITRHNSRWLLFSHYLWAVISYWNDLFLLHFNLLFMLWVYDPLI